MIINDSNQFVIYLKTFEWLGSMSYFILETSLADHNWDVGAWDVSTQILISDNDYKTWQASWYMLQGSGKQTGWGKSRRRMKGAEVGNKKMNGWKIKNSD